MQRNQTLTFPDLALDPVVERDNGIPYFVRTWYAEAVPASGNPDLQSHDNVRFALGAGVMTARFECTVTLHLAGGSAVQDPSFRCTGPIGFARGDQVQGVGTVGEPIR